MLRYLAGILAASSLATAAESFENLPPSPITSGAVEFGTLKADDGHACIDEGHARSGNKALRLMGGNDRQVTIEFPSALDKSTVCRFWAERWTNKQPFRFKTSAIVNGREKELETTNNVSTGSYKHQARLILPAGTTAIRFTATTAQEGGVLIDDLQMDNGAYVIKDVKVNGAQAYPILKRAPINPVASLRVSVDGCENPSQATVSLTVSNASAIKNVTLRSGNDQGSSFRNGKTYGSAAPAENGKVTIALTQPLESGETTLWIDAEPSEKALVGSLVSFSDITLKAGDKTFTGNGEPITQRIGYLVSLPDETVGGQSNGAKPRPCVSFRIPGLIRTKKGTLIGCFDARYNHSRDLCADIDVAVVRSTDGGQTWSRPKVGMDAGPGDDNGCGDPCILQDKKGRIWLQSLVCHFKGGASLGVSQKGFDEKKTGQWCMTYSDDEGKTWSKKWVNPTRQIKQEQWTTILAGPGNGICTKKGVIVFPAQIWERGAKINCMSTICYSRDGGKTWKYGKGVPHNTSECQVVELQDGSLMLNCRNERRQGQRIVYTTQDFGETWQPHETNNNTLREPTCQASLIAAETGKYGRLLLFSNPKSGGRNTMTVRASQDEGKTWNDGYLYDSRGCWGYSCLAMIDRNTVGVLYEAPHVSETSDLHGIGFLPIPVESIMTGKDLPYTPAPNKKAKKGS